MMDFSDALEALKEGKIITREAWGDEETNVRIGEENGCDIGVWKSKDHEPQIFLPSWPDLMAKDWKTVVEKSEEA